jgi:hypothetical protein
MEEGMGIIRKANALSEELGPSLGRGLGMVADRERPISNVPTGGEHQQHDHGAPGMVSPGASSVPGYPQDMWMPMDELVANKPEVFGLRKGWTAAMMGMMTLVRVLPNEMYDRIDAMRKAAPARQSYKVSFRTDPTPPVGSENATIHVSITDSLTGEIVRDATVRMTMLMPAMPAMGMPEMRDSTDLRWNGTDYSGSLKILMSGSWNVLIEIARAGQPTINHRLRLDAR